MKIKVTVFSSQNDDFDFRNNSKQLTYSFRPPDPLELKSQENGLQTKALLAHTQATKNGCLLFKINGSVRTTARESELNIHSQFFICDHLFTVVSINTDKSVISHYEEDYSITSYKSESTVEPNRCKICYEGHGDLLTDLCKCSGSVAAVHFRCLQRWIKTRGTILNEGNVLIMEQQVIICEICKNIYKLKSGASSFMDYPLQNFVLIRDSFKGRTRLFLLMFDKQTQFTLGRGEDCDVKLKESIVSRHHSKIIFWKNKVILKDLKSRFGTTLKLNEIELDQQTQLIYRNKLFKFQFKRKQRTACRFY